jgi:hypothetical protein
MSADPNLLVPKNLMDKDFLSNLFKTDIGSATNAETGILGSIPKLVNAEEVQQVLDGMSGSSIKMDLLEDFLSFNEDPIRTENMIAERTRNAAVAEGINDEKVIAARISNRQRTIGLIRQRYTALENQKDEVYQQFKRFAEDGGAVTAEGVITPRITKEATEDSMGTISESIESMMKRFIRENEDNETRAARAASESFAETVPLASGKYTRIQDFIKSPQMREMYQGALRNKGKIAGVAALATGLAVFGSINKKERTQEAMSGPPLLPGGNPYERIPTQQMQIPDAPIASGNQGMSYNISVNGDQGQMEELMNRARISNKWTG